MTAANVHFVQRSRRFTIRTVSQTQKAAKAMARTDRRMVMACVSGIEIEDGRLHCRRRARWIEVLAQQGNLTAGSSQKNHIFLSVGSPGGLDDALCLHLGDRRCWICKGMHPDVEEAEILHRPDKPGRMAHRLVAARKSGRMAEGNRVRQFPDEVIRQQCLPLRIVGDKGFKMFLQEIGGNVHPAILPAVAWGREDRKGEVGGLSLALPGRRTLRRRTLGPPIKSDAAAGLTLSLPKQRNLRGNRLLRPRIVQPLGDMICDPNPSRRSRGQPA